MIEIRKCALSRRVAAVSVLSLSSLACRQSESHVLDGPVVRDSAGVRIVENGLSVRTLGWHVVQPASLSIGSATGSPNQQLYQVVGASRLADGRVVVANGGTLELRFYGGDGQFLTRVGRRGGGPGEFQSLEWIARLGSDSILALDVLSHRVSYFDIDGRFGRSVRLEPSAEIPGPRPVGFFADGSMLATHGLYVLGAELPIRSERDQEGLFRYMPDGKTVERVGSFPGPERDIVTTRPATSTGAPRVERRPRPFGRKTVFAAAGDRFYVADNEAYEIRVYSVDPVRLLQIVRKEYVPVPVTDDDLRRYRDSVLASRSGAARRIELSSFENRPPPPRSMPAYAPEIHLDPYLNLWVRDLSGRGDPNSWWSVFAADGSYVGSVEMPAGLGIFEIGEDYLLGLRRDELDVEYVELYELIR